MLVLNFSTWCRDMVAFSSYRLDNHFHLSLNNSDKGSLSSMTKTFARSRRICDRGNDKIHLLRCRLAWRLRLFLRRNRIREKRAGRKEGRRRKERRAERRRRFPSGERNKWNSDWEGASGRAKIYRVYTCSGYLHQTLKSYFLTDFSRLSFFIEDHVESFFLFTTSNSKYKNFNRKLLR